MWKLFLRMKTDSPVLRFQMRTKLRILIFLHLMQTGIPFFSLKLVYRKDRLIAVKLNHRELSPEEIGSLISSPI